MFMIHFDKKGRPIKGQQCRMLVWITQHAVESLFQRLKTLSVSRVLEELRTLAEWLYAHQAEIGIHKGILLTASGFFVIHSAIPFQSSGIDGRQHWDAATWISDEGMEDHTSAKRRIATAVRNAREVGLRAGLIQV